MINMRTTKKWDFTRQCGSNVTRPRFKPLSTFEELAEKLDVLVGQLRYAMQHSPIAVPDPNLITGGKRWYDFDTMKAWWDAIGGKEFAVSGRADYNQRWREKQASSQSSMTVDA